MVFLDESGDLGWTFTAPYRQGGSSRNLTIAGLVVTEGKKKRTKNLIKDLYTKFGWPPKVEKKWSKMSLNERIWFAQEANTLQERYPNEIQYISVTVKKECVKPCIRSDDNTLYTYMIGMAFLDEMSKHNSVKLIKDHRSIKLASSNSLRDYLRIQLWFDKHVETRLTIDSLNSDETINLQFSDMLAGIVQGHFEDSNSQPWEKIHTSINCKTLLF